MPSITRLATLAVSSLLTLTSAQCVCDVRTIDADTRNVTSAVNNMDSTIFGPTFESTEPKLESDLKSFYTCCNSGKVQTVAAAAQCSAYLNNTLEPDTAAMLKLIMNRKPSFATAGLASTVLADLKNLQNETSAACACQIKHTPTSQAGAIQSTCSKIYAEYQSAIAAYK